MAAEVLATAASSSSSSQAVALCHVTGDVTKVPAVTSSLVDYIATKGRKLCFQVLVGSFFSFVNRQAAASNLNELFQQCFM